MYFFEYWATIYDAEENYEEPVSGVVCGENFSEAMEEIEEYYDPELVNIKIRITDFESVYEFPKNKTEDINYDDNFNNTSGICCNTKYTTH